MSNYIGLNIFCRNTLSISKISSVCRGLDYSIVHTLTEFRSILVGICVSNGDHLDIAIIFQVSVKLIKCR